MLRKLFIARFFFSNPLDNRPTGLYVAGMNEKSETGGEARQAKREALIERAAAIFARKGYRSCGVQELIGELGLSKGGFYWYFSSKEDLYREICRAQCRRHREIFLELLANEMLDTDMALAVTRRMLDWFLDRPDDMRLIMDFHHESHTPAIREELSRLDRDWTRILADVIEKLAAKGLICKVASSEDLARQCLVFFHGVLLLYGAQGDKSAVHEAWNLFLRRMFLSDQVRREGV